MAMIVCSGCGKKIHHTNRVCPHCNRVPQKIESTKTLDATSDRISLEAKNLQSMENTSGQGKSTVVPDEVKGWSWGAFFLNWIWAIGNRTWIGLLALIPYIGIVVAIILGAKGREWAWKNKRWKDIDHFSRIQRRWSYCGVGLVIGLFCTVIIIGSVLARNLSGTNLYDLMNKLPDPTYLDLPETIKCEYQGLEQEHKREIRIEGGLMGGIIKNSYIRLSFAQYGITRYVLIIPTGKHPYSTSIWLHPSEGKEAASIHKPVKIIFNPPGEKGIKSIASLLPPESWQGYPSSIVLYNQMNEKRIYIAYRTGTGDNDIYWSIADATDFHTKPNFITTFSPLKKIDEIISFPIMVAAIVIGYSSTSSKKDVCTPHSYYNSVAFSPDGRYALTGSSDRAVKLWDINSGEKIRVFTGHTDNVRSVAFSPDGRNLVSSAWDRTIILWDLNSGSVVQTFTGHKADQITSVAFSPDGRFILSGSWDETVKVWDTESGNEIRSFQKESSRLYKWHLNVDSVAYSPSGRYALSGSSGTEVNLWEIESGKHVRTFLGHQYMDVNSVAFSPDGRYVLSGGDYKDGTMKLWELESGWEILSLKQNSGAVNSVTFSPDGRFILSGNENGCILLWELATRRLVRFIEGHRGSVRSVAFSSDSRLMLSGSEDETLKLWDVSTGKEIRTFKSEPEKYASKYQSCNKGNSVDR